MLWGCVSIRLKELKKKKTFLEHDVSAIDTIENENAYLHTQIIKLVREYELSLIDQEKERENVKQRNFDTRMTMEQVLRREIQTLDTNFKDLAVCDVLYSSCIHCAYNIVKSNVTNALDFIFGQIASMNDEALTASNENKGLYVELSRREEKALEMIEEQQASYEELQRVTIEHEVMITAAEYYETVIDDLARVVLKQERWVRWKLASLNTSLLARLSGDACKYTRNLYAIYRTNVIS